MQNANTCCCQSMSQLRCEAEQSLDPRAQVNQKVIMKVLQRVLGPSAQPDVVANGRQVQQTGLDQVME